MSNMSNYPDDIRAYDSDPRSPFYVDSVDGLDGLTKRELIALRDQLEGMCDELTGRASSTARTRLAAMQDLIDCTPWEDKDYIEVARKRCDDDLKIDPEKNILVSQGSNKGAWVQAWIWVSDDEVKQ